VEPRRVPVLLLAYNRLDTLQQVWNALRQAKPATLFVSVDGPKPTPEDQARVEAVRSFVQSHIDWPCDAYFNFYPENQGCKLGVAGGLNWFFSQVEEGIVLEDDTLPHPSFFAYAAEMLERYRDEPRVGCISGLQVLTGWRFTTGWIFIRLPLIWGWASWRRAWEGYDPFFQEWPKPRRETFLQQALSGNPILIRSFSRGLTLLEAGQIDTWDIQWGFWLMQKNQLSVVPAYNLIRNLGIGHSLALNTKKRRPWQNLPLEPWQGGKPPPAILPDLPYERAWAYYFGAHAAWLKAWYRLGGDYPYRSLPWLHRILEKYFLR